MLIEFCILPSPLTSHQDIGVYAPLAADDKKREDVFNCKTYCFSMRTEHYSFESPDDDYLFDISDDQTGEPHETGKSMRFGFY